VVIVIAVIVAVTDARRLTRLITRDSRKTLSFFIERNACRALCAVHWPVGVPFFARNRHHLREINILK